MRVNCADMHFKQKFQQNNHSFSFYGPFYTQFLAHNFSLQEKLPDVSLGYCNINNWNLAQQNCMRALAHVLDCLCVSRVHLLLVFDRTSRHSDHSAYQHSISLVAMQSLHYAMVSL